MAIMAVAAVAGASAVGAGVVAASTLAMISVGVTAVGIVTKSKLLVKIGGGLGMGSAAAGMMGLGQSAAANAAEAAYQGAEGAASWSQAGAQEVAAGAGASALENSAPAVIDAATTPATTGVVEAMAPAEVGKSVAQAPLSQTPVDAPKPVASPDPAASTPTPPTSLPPGRSDTAGGLPAQPARPEFGLKMPSAVEPSKIPALSTLKRGDDFFGSIGQFWDSQSPSGKLAIGQTASGLISGIGSGAARYMGAKEDRAWQQSQIDRRRRDLSAVPDLTPYSR